ncbi:MAG TPA: DUF1080 domain-containing protein [Draconibacterium sp.]|nr:DUF1080 domain-containing protein [Draconibacterium sp.]
MKKIIAGIVFAGFFCCCTNSAKESNNQLTKNEIEEGWELLFDGKTFSGWRGLGRDTVETNNWKVENGEIHKVDSRLVPPMPNGEKINGGDLMTTDTFDNFELSFEWKIKEAGNSGIKYNVSEELTNAWGSKYSALGFEYQILDNDHETYRDLKPHQFTGALYEMYAPENVQLKPVGEYNSSKIVLNGNHGEHWLNGIKVVEFEFGSAEFDSLFQLSKYAKYPGFEQRRTGHIVITNHTDESWYRNIKIKRIK